VSTADREHLHHRLMRLGHGPRRSVAILWLWTALASAAALIPTFTNRGNALVPLALGALALLLFTYFHPGVRTQRAEEALAAARERDGGGDDQAVIDLEQRRQARG
jgi:UDP-GlcNAc:undecaprenyl-phosphate GlcNAc-1-phosphate transferase